ncbi:MAG: CDP-diacylglycerol--serine O-phosphatidyltransferase [Candidatus Latescibacterota bacterium]
MYRRMLPNLCTIGNLFCGFLALHYIIQGNVVPAAWLIVLGAVFDKMDGKLARAMGRSSQFGIEFDSIVDVCTFGVAPAVMIYRTHLESPWGLGLAFLYLLAGAFRLARFNTISLAGEKGDYYLGLPIPVAAVCLTQYVAFTERAWESSHAAALATLLVLLLAFLMVSRIDYDSMPDFRAKGLGERLKQAYFLGGVVLVIHPRAKDFLFPLVLVYILSGVYRWVVGLFSDEVTQQA